MEGIGIGKAAELGRVGQSAVVSKEERGMDRHIGELIGTCVRVRTIRERLGQLHARIYGPRPQEPESGKTPAPNPLGWAPQVDVAIHDAASNLSAIEELLSEVERYV